jgi:hypothetical protein
MGKLNNMAYKQYCKRIMASWSARLVMVSAAVLMFTQVPMTVGANPGITVTNAGIVDTVSPGQVLTQKMAVSIANSDPATNITVTVTGVGQSLTGGYILLDPAQDTNQNTARPFVTVNPSSFPLQPGQSQDITATINIPQNIGSGSYFAIISIAEPPAAASGSNVAIIYSVSVPVFLTIAGSQLTQMGTITGINAGDITNGQPINITTTFQNTGNIYFKVEGQTTITNDQGVTLDTIPMPLTSSSIIPGMSRNLDAIFTPSGSLSPGTYTIRSVVMSSDSILLDKSDGTFTIKAPYKPPPALGTVSLAPSGASTLKTTTGNISIFFPVGSAAIPVDISLNNITAAQLPVAPDGYGFTGTYFQINGLTGLLAKDAAVTVQYTADDLSKAGGKASSLVLTRWDPGTNKWVVLRTKANNTAMTLSANSKQLGIMAVAASLVPPSSGINWIIIGPIIAVVIILAIVGTVLMTRRKRVKPAKR